MTDAAAYRAVTASVPVLDTDTAAAVVSVTAVLFDVTDAELRDSRQRWHVDARQVAMAVCRANTAMSWCDLGRFFDRDHTTVISAVERVLRTPEMCAWAHAVEQAMAPSGA